MDRYALLADLVLVVHAVYIAFVVLGLVAVLVGRGVGWDWVRNFWFRTAHLAAIGLVVMQALAGIDCPLTLLENNLRIRAGQDPYAPDGFIAHWLHQVIFYDLAPWVFTTIYVTFGLLVAATFIWARPRWPWQAKPHPGLT